MECRELCSILNVVHQYRKFNSGTHVESGISVSALDALVTPSQIALWNETHPREAALSERFLDLIRYEVPISRLARHIPMILRLDAHEMPEEKIVNLNAACTSWNKLSGFYQVTLKEILELIEKNDQYFSDSRFERYKSCCLALPGFTREISQAHLLLRDAISALYQAGFCASALRPASEERFYRSTG